VRSGQRELIESTARLCELRTICLIKSQYDAGLSFNVLAERR
jgi:hypothetical protein